MSPATRILLARWSGAALLGLSITAPCSAGESAAATPSDSRKDTSGLPEGVSPWWPSRYGADDQIGTLNEITPAVVRRAAQLVKRGSVIDLGRVLDEDTPKFPGRYWHQTVDVSAYSSNARRSDAVGKGWGRNQINWITEIQAGTFQVGTQLDSIGHIQIGDRFYNGWSVKDLVEPWGFNRLGIETVPPIVTRGVLIDVAALKGLDRLAKGYVISVADLQACACRQGIAAGRRRRRAHPYRLGRAVRQGQRAVSFRRTRGGPGRRSSGCTKSGLR